MAASNTCGEGGDMADNFDVGDYFFQTKELQDVNFIVGKQQESISVVRALLINQSRVWWSMLSKESPLAEKGDIVVPDIEPETFKILLKHCYGGLPDDEVLDLSRCADKYLMSTLKEKIAASLNPKDVDEVFHALHCLAHYNLGVDNEAVKKIVQTQTLEIFAHPQFLECDEDSITYITKQDCLSCEEIQLWKAVVKWAKNKAGSDEGSKLREWMLRPLQHIRLLTLRESELYRHVFTTNILSGDEVASICTKRNVPKRLCEETEIRKLSNQSFTISQEGIFKVDIAHDKNIMGRLPFSYTTTAYFLINMENICLKYITCEGFMSVSQDCNDELNFNYIKYLIFRGKSSVDVNIKVTHMTNLHRNTSDEEPTVINVPGIVFHHFDRFNIPVNILLQANYDYKIELIFSKSLICLARPSCENGHEFEHGWFYCSQLYENIVGRTPCHILGFGYNV